MRKASKGRFMESVKLLLQGKKDSADKDDIFLLIFKKQFRRYCILCFSK